MATLTSTKIKNTYDALLKATDNDAIGSTAKQITDGLGNGTPLYISTTQIGIGVTPEATYDLHVYSNAKVGGNLTVTGDLTVEGTTTTIDTQTLTVEDPLIEVASNNTSTDAVDIGFYGKYAPSGTTLYAGLFRDTGDSKFKLFRNLEEQPTTTVNTSGTGYTIATLVADIEGTLTGTIASSTVATTQSVGDNSTKVATTAYVDSSIGNSTLAEVLVNGNTTSGTDIAISSGDDITFVDDSKAIFGTDSDLEIYHYSVTDTATISINGQLDIRANTLQLRNYSGETYLNASSNGAVRLYYDALEKFITTSTGISVTDTVSATTFSGQLDGTISSTTTATTQTAGDNSTKVATTAYVDSAITAEDLDFAGDSGTGSVDLDSQTFTIAGGTNVTTSASGQTITINASGSVDGSGTANYVAKWSDTDTITNSIIYDSGSQIGIGVTPSQKLQVEGIIKSSGSSNSLMFSDRTTAANTWEWYSDGNNAGLYKNHNIAATVMTIDSSGNVGIGETSLSSTRRLHISGTQAYDTASGGNGTGGIYIKGGTAGDNNYSSGIGFSIGTGTSGISGVQTEGSDADRMGLAFFTHGSGTGSAASSEAMRIESNGNVGIGTTSPSYKLSVVNSGNVASFGDGTRAFRIYTDADEVSLLADGSVPMKFYTSGAERMRITSAGDVQLVGNKYLYANPSAGSTTIGSGFNLDGSNNLMTLWTNDIERMRIDSSGNVGIGVSPYSFTQLHIYDTSDVFLALQKGTANGYIINDGTNISLASDQGTTGKKLLVNRSAPDSSLVIDSSGNVGIGYTSPSSFNQRVNAPHLVVGSGSNSAGVTIFSGTASQGSINFADGTTTTDQYTGGIVYVHGSDNYMSFHTNGGTERMRIDSSGNVGIGTSSPTAPLMIAGSGADGTAMLRLEATAGSQNFNWISSAVYPNLASGKTAIKLFGQAQSLNNQAYIGFKYVSSGSTSNQLTLGFYANNFLVNLLANGNLGIGTTSPTEKLFVGSGNIGLNDGYALKWGSSYIDGVDASDILRFYTSSTERVRVDSSGNVTIGSASSNHKLYVYDNNNRTEATASFSIRGNGYNAFQWLDGTAYYIGQNSSIRSLRIYSGAETAGVQLSAGGTSWGTFSDERLKENIEDLGLVSDKIKNIRCITYNRNDIEDSKKTIGFIAQDFVGKFDEVLDKSKIQEDGEEYYSIKYTETIPILLKAIQELKAEIETLKAQINN